MRPCSRPSLPPIERRLRLDANAPDLRACRTVASNQAHVSTSVAVVPSGELVSSEAANDGARSSSSCVLPPAEKVTTLLAASSTANQHLVASLPPSQTVPRLSPTACRASHPALARPSASPSAPPPGVRAGKQQQQPSRRRPRAAASARSPSNACRPSARPSLSPGRWRSRSPSGPLLVVRSHRRARPAGCSPSKAPGAPSSRSRASLPPAPFPPRQEAWLTPPCPTHGSPATSPSTSTHRSRTRRCTRCTTRSRCSSRATRARPAGGRSSTRSVPSPAARPPTRLLPVAVGRCGTLSARDSWFWRTGTRSKAERPAAFAPLHLALLRTSGRSRCAGKRVPPALL